MRNTSKAGDIAADVKRVKDLLALIGKRRSLRDPLAAVMEESQLTAPQAHALFWLGLGPLTMGELAQRIGITVKTVTGVVDRLERGGYVRRERSEEDRRVVHVLLTKKGQVTYAEFDATLDDQLGTLLQMLDAEDRRGLFRILEKLLSRLVPDASAESAKKDVP